MNIYDCFMYFDEDLLLDIRLNILNKYVKKFIISEATYSHNGKEKSLKFNPNNFRKFKDKITYIVVDDPPPNLLKFEKDDSNDLKSEKLILNGLARDIYQRESLSKGLDQLSEEDLIIISDLDEIPNLEGIDFDQIKDKLILFKQKIFFYKLNLYYEKFEWFGSKACKKKNFISPQWLRNIKSTKYPKWRIDTYLSKKKYSDIFHVENGGWHFTCLKTPEDLEKKLLNFAHHFEFEESGLKIEDIKKMIRENKAIYDYSADMKENKWSGKIKLKKANMEELPDFINVNKKKYKDWLS